MFPEIGKPVARLREFTGAMMTRFARVQMEQLGLSHRAFARQMGIMQSTYANAIRGHDPVSGWVVNWL